MLCRDNDSNNTLQKNNLFNKRTKTTLFVSDTAKNTRHNRRSIFIAEEVNFYALLLLVLSLITRIKRGETVLIMDGVPSK